MPTSRVRYELFYWPGIQGRGEFIRLAFEEAGVEYIDVARQPGGMREMEKLLKGQARFALPFAPPFVRVGDFVLAQSSAILHYLGSKLGLVPADERSQLTALGLQLTIADLVHEAHDVHHPIASGLYYEDQKPEARRRASDFLAHRVPKFLAHFEQTLARNTKAKRRHLVGTACSYVDLSLFQVISGLHYAFPNALSKLAPKYPLAVALHAAVEQRPRIAAYLASPRRVAFNQHGIFRHYPELDAPAKRLRAAKRSRATRASQRI